MTQDEIIVKRIELQAELFSAQHTLNLLLGKLEKLQQDCPHPDLLHFGDAKYCEDCGMDGKI